MSETPLMRRLMKKATRLGARLFRQNTGMGWVGRSQRFDRPGTIEVRPGDVVIRNARPFHAGFEGLSDSGGWSPLVITPELMGATVAIYTQVEVKEDARPTTAQLDWIAAVKAAGGRAGIAHNEDELAAILSARPGA
ncbi:hypothetical protein GOC60_14850 [Sinorhizobium meliloti]|nr:hypothetical protein [Sinorhizobium meliloti]